jgi:hypothetical protein
LVKAFIEGEFEGGRHMIRVEKNSFLDGMVKSSLNKSNSAAYNIVNPDNPNALIIGCNHRQHTDLAFRDWASATTLRLKTNSVVF